jgi:hypothetical protein
MRAEKTEKFKELKRGTPEFELWFLNYKPSTGEKVEKKNDINKKKVIVKKKTRNLNVYNSSKKWRFHKKTRKNKGEIY